MSGTKETIIKSIFHTVEIVLAGAFILALLYFFKDDMEVVESVKKAALTMIPVAVAAFGTKFAREHERIPITDYVNER